ncbi:MAG TPA: 16S rRNA (adenine(1518)-N(6)/adenine(1519)-N(6))-dimethyltransferase [Deltaproteobacteria bacterium]|nr:16S rRNA (adenine(1518)-N(6)/adenine(1519)-N(6))-dimethyltransferase [Deltaproteobacteria bacterium]
MLSKRKKIFRTPINRQLRSYGLSPLKRFSQNFLVDERIADKIVDTLKLTVDDIVIEVGPGLGILTERLLDTGARVLAIEIDRGLADVLSKRFCERDNFEKIICQDALKVSYKEMANQYGKKCKVVSNLPYNISTPIIFKFLEEREAFSMFLLMLQKEVAERIVSRPDTKEYGVLSVLIQLLADVAVEFDVPPSCFYPEPKVYSSVVRFNILQRPRIDVDDVVFFKKVVKAAFGHRRKTLLNALKSLKLPSEQVKEGMKTSGINPQRRGETLSLKEFGILSVALRKRLFQG